MACALGLASLAASNRQGRFALALDIDAALLFVGVMTVPGAALWFFRGETGSSRTRVRLTLALLLSLSSLGFARGLFRGASPLRVVEFALAIAGCFALLAAFLSWLAPGRLLRWLDGRRGRPIRREQDARQPQDKLLYLVFGLGYLGLLLGFHLSMVVLGVIFLAAAAVMLGRRHGTGPSWVWLVVTVAPMLALWWALSVIAGPDGLWQASFDQLPLSPTAELALSLLLLLTVWALLGLWPLRLGAASALLTPAATALMIRLGVTLMPLGLEHWQPVVFPVAVLATWHAAATRRVGEALAAGILAALVSLVSLGLAGALWLTGVAVMREARRRVALPPAGDEMLNGGLWLAGAWGGYLALRAGLSVEVTYSLLMLAGVAPLLASRTARTAQVGVASPDDQFHIWPRHDI